MASETRPHRPHHNHGGGEMSGSYYDVLALESRAYDIAHWIAMEARVSESLDRSVAPIESEGARRIVALASARPTPADVRERVVDEIVSTFRTLYPHARGSVAPAAYAAADRILALLRTPRGEGEAEALAAEILAELRRAREKFPGDNVTTLALVEEVGELAKATFEESRDRVRQEAIQVAVMAMRVVLDGDQTLDAWRESKGLDPLTAARRGEGGGE